MSITSDSLLLALARLHQAGIPWVSSSELTAAIPNTSWATVKRRLQALLQSRHVIHRGRARATRYRLVDDTRPYSTYRVAEAKTECTVAARPCSTPYRAAADVAIIGPTWSSASLVLQQSLHQPLAARAFVSYQRDFVDAYVPNASSLLSASLADALLQEGSMPGQQPAGTYARKVLEPLLIDLSWSSSRLEGNRYSVLATKELFRHGFAGGDLDAVMLLNHKLAIEFLVETVPQQGLSEQVVRNLHALLMQDLIADPASLGNIRHKMVNIRGTTYQPNQVPAFLGQMLTLILDKARHIKNPVEAAFFLWVNLAYLQPFEDGNKRTSRLSANIPLMLYNCAPLSFLDIAAQDYVDAMLGVYEQGNVALAVDLFHWAYRRSIRRYAVMLEAVSAPDPIRLQFRQSLRDAIHAIVVEGHTMPQAVAALSLPDAQAALFTPLLAQELNSLDVHNCARYRLSLAATQAWIQGGRMR